MNVHSTLLSLSVYVRHMSRRYLSVPVGGVEPLHGVMKSLSLEIVAQACFSLPLGLLDEQVRRTIPYKHLKRSNPRGFPYLDKHDSNA